MSQVSRRIYKYYDFVMAMFVTILLYSNVIGAAKVATVWGFTFGSLPSPGASLRLPLTTPPESAES